MFDWVTHVSQWESATAMPVKAAAAVIADVVQRMMRVVLLLRKRLGDGRHIELWKEFRDS